MSELKPTPPDGKRVSALIADAKPRQLVFSSGARAVACGELLEVISSEGHLLASFDSATGAMTLRSPGDLKLSSAGTLRLRSAEAVEFDAPAIRQRCRTFELHASDARLEATSWRLQAQRILEHGTDVYRRVERVYETRARTIRNVAARSLSFLAERSSLVSREETRVDGKRVLIG